MNQTNWASLSLRMTLGIMFLAHGSQKVFGAFGGGGPASAVEAARMIGFEPAFVFGFLLAMSEFGGGLFLLIGLLTRWATLPLMFVMSVAISTVHGPKGFFLENGGFEYTWVILGGLMALLFLGSGSLSLDGFLAKCVGRSEKSSP